MLWNSFLFLAAKNQKKSAKQFGLEEKVVNEMVSVKDLPQRLASGVMLSFVLKQTQFPFEQNLCPNNKVSSQLKPKVSLVDFSYWSALKQLAQEDTDMAIACYGLPRKSVEWTSQASEVDIFNVAAGTTYHLTSRYPSWLIKEMLVLDGVDETLMCKKAVVAAERMTVEAV